jgi:long-chain acyl-CoA synthetase
VFKTSKGKFVVPASLEGKFARNHHLAQYCVVGHGMDQPILLATLSETSRAQDQEVTRGELEALLDEVNSELSSHERVATIYVDDEWTIENNMLTPTMKLKRNLIEDRYRSRMGQGESGERVVFL